ncbi:MAG: pyridoxal phosphate-dependent aminotransferase [Phycisphaerales bacterium]
MAASGTAVGGVIPLSQRATMLRPPATLAIMAKAKALQREGAPVISFGLGEPDFDTPERIKRAAADALVAGQTHYMPTLGDPETRRVIAEKLVRENGLEGVTEAHVAISTGAKQSLYLVCQCLLGGGTEGRRDGGTKGEGASDEALLPVPAWVSYAPMVQLAGGRVRELPTEAKSGFKISAAQLKAAITPRSRVLFLNSPSNPCGTMYTPGELREIAAVVAEAAATVAPNLVIVTDEIYEKIIYGGIPHFSIGSVPEVAERTVTINGLSKAFAMTGWRIGYAAAPGEFGARLMKAFEALQGQMTSCITSFLYPAIRVALRECAEDTERFRQRFAQRAELVCGRLAAIPGLPAPRPTGAFYVFPDVSAHYGKRSHGGKEIRTGMDFAEALLSEHHVAVVPGEEFGGVGKNHVRLSFACAEEEIEQGMTRVAHFVAGLR